MYESAQALEVALQAAVEASETYGEWFPATSFQQRNVELEVVQRLVRDSVLQMQISPDFADEEFWLEWARFEFRMAHTLGEPELVREHPREVGDVAQMAKLEIMGVLLRLGWTDGGRRAVKESDEPKRFCLQALARGKMYWVALFRSEFIFRVGSSLWSTVVRMVILSPC